VSKAPGTEMDGHRGGLSSKGGKREKRPTASSNKTIVGPISEPQITGDLGQRTGLATGGIPRGLEGGRLRSQGR